MSSLNTRIKEALSQKPISELKFDVFLETVKTEVEKAHKFLGYKPSPHIDLNDMINDLAKYIKDNYGYLKQGEFEIASELGYTGQYGEFIGLSIKTFLSWIRSYLNSELRATSYKSWKEEQPKTELSQKELDEKNERAIREMARDCWENYLRTDVVNDVRNFCFDYLEKTDQIKIDLEPFKQHARLRIREENSQMTLDLAKRSQMKGVISRLEGGDYEENVIIQAKKLALEEIFNNYFKTKTEPKF